MARRYSRSSSRGAGRGSYGNRGRAVRGNSYRSRSTSRTGRRSSGRRSSGGSRTIRIEVVQPSVNPIARPEIGMKPAPAARKAMF